MMNAIWFTGLVLSGMANAAPPQQLNQIYDGQVQGGPASASSNTSTISLPSTSKTDSNIQTLYLSPSTNDNLGMANQVPDERAYAGQSSIGTTLAGSEVLNTYSYEDYPYSISGDQPLQPIYDEQIQSQIQSGHAYTPESYSGYMDYVPGSSSRQADLEDYLTGIKTEAIGAVPDVRTPTTTPDAAVIGGAGNSGAKVEYIGETAEGKPVEHVHAEHHGETAEAVEYTGAASYNFVPRSAFGIVLASAVVFFMI